MPLATDPLQLGVMFPGPMAAWKLCSVCLVVAAFATVATSQTWRSLDKFPHFSLSGKGLEEDDFADKRQEASDDDYDDYSDGFATYVGEEYSTKSALKPRVGQTQKCPFIPDEPTTTEPPSTTFTEPPSTTFTTVSAPSRGPRNCALNQHQRVPCASGTTSRTVCEEAGCCFESTCFYPMNECTKDEHMVFVIYADVPKRDPVVPSELTIPSDRSCRPFTVNSKFAIFKFSIHECGTHSYTIGGTKIYMAEVETPVTVLNQKFGMITRSKPVRFLFECRYDVGGPVSQPSLISIEYRIKTPFSNFPTQIVSDGLFAVQLRLARDATFNNWVVDRVPLRELVNGQPLYLEVRLRSPRPQAVLIVNYCIAYPRTARNALVLIYEGCANSFDPTVAILRVAAANRHTRRFMVDAFQFMEVRDANMYINEDIYFMCSTELCMPIEGECPQRCFDGKPRQ